MVYQAPPPAPYQGPTTASTSGLPPPVAVQVVPGTQFGVAIVGVSPTTSGPATASVLAGVGSILVAIVVACFGALGASGGWGPTVAGAFAVLAGLAGLAGVILGRAGLRQIRRAVGWQTVTGRGLAISGIVCGACGLALTGLSMLAAVVLAISA